MTLNSSSSGTNSSNNSSLLRYPSLNGAGGIGNGNLDYLLGMPGTPSLQNYGLAVGAGGAGNGGSHHQQQQPTSPFMRYPNSLPNLGPGGFIFNNDYERPRAFEEKSRPIRSPLLEEFRADKLKRWGVRVSDLCYDELESSKKLHANQYETCSSQGHAWSYCRIHV